MKVIKSKERKKSVYVSKNFGCGNKCGCQGAKMAPDTGGGGNNR